jgi:hypothetical protein
MRKKFTQNDNQTSNATTFRKEYLEQYAIKQNNVDINTLLNRVKIDKSNKIKENLIFLCISILASGILGAFVLI